MNDWLSNVGGITPCQSYRCNKKLLTNIERNCMCDKWLFSPDTHLSRNSKITNLNCNKNYEKNYVHLPTYKKHALKCSWGIALLLLKIWYVISSWLMKTMYRMTFPFLLWLSGISDTDLCLSYSNYFGLYVCLSVFSFLLGLFLLF